MRVTVDEDLCTGCELCVNSCPDIFRMEDDVAVAYANNDPVPEEMEECAQEASDMCPVDAIPVE